MADSKSEIVVYSGPDQGGLVARAEPVTARNAPVIVKAAGRSAEFAWEEFFQAELANALHFPRTDLDQATSLNTFSSRSWIFSDHGAGTWSC